MSAVSQTPHRPSAPAIIIRLEGLTVFLAATVAYINRGESLWLYAILFFTPDLGMLGYLRGVGLGSLTYNLVHNYMLPVALLGLALALGITPAIPLIWIAHIGFDRLFGYGLKYATAFKDTHIQHL